MGPGLDPMHYIRRKRGGPWGAPTTLLLIYLYCPRPRCNDGARHRVSGLGAVVRIGYGFHGVQI